MPTEQKVDLVKTIEQRVDSSVGVYVVDYKGIDVEKLSDLRKKFREADSEMRVSKNTLTRIALTSLGKEGLLDYLSGQTALVYCNDDFIKPAKVIKDFVGANNKLLTVKGGLIEGQIVSAEDVSRIADIPPREQLLVQILGSLISPVSGFAGVLNGVLRNFAGVIDAIAKEKEKSN